ncbi:MAG: hydrogenase iron-sulfur subunit [Methanomassiliicoccales archaeon]|nr:MAG: hydrogenase iron-sulfur subunit [Methanomassiliicoccales archaeon]
MAAKFEPKLIGFLCNWCSYAGADLAGVSRYQYPANLRIVRVMCSGRMEPSLILEMFIQGADGVLIGGCHPGDCHYLEGNYQAERKVKMTKKLVKRAGLEPERLRLEWISAAEGERFAETIRDFTKQLKEMGPSPVSGDAPDIDKLMVLFAAKNAAKDFRLKLLVSRELGLVEEGNVYDEKIPQKEMDDLLESAIGYEMARCSIIFSIRDKALSVEELSERLDLPTDKVLQHIVTLRDRGLVILDRIEEDTPLYLAQEEGIK